MFSSCRKSVVLARYTPCVQPVRYKRVNVDKPRAPHYEKALTLETCKPIYAAPCDVHFPAYIKCRDKFEKMDKLSRIEEENPYERILANELIDNFNKSKMIMFFHRNSACAEDKYEARLQLKKIGMDLLVYGRSTVRMATKDTKFETIMKLFEGHTAVVTSEEVKLNLFFKTTKKISYLVFLAGIVENKFLSRSQLEYYSKLDLQTARAQLVSTLNAASSQLVQRLNQPQMTLVSYLDQYNDRESTLEKNTESTVSTDTAHSDQ